jgi:superfamily II DNA or RNA helicase
LDERAIESHLRGERTLGVYAIGADDSCRFLAADFDGEGWREDVLAYQEASKRTGIGVAVERSRSDNGAHAWIFFSESVPAAAARKLGLILIAKASALRPTMGLAAYDRLFPNQDTLPTGGFGNLIALPLAKAPRQRGNAVFVDDQFEPWADQWAYLAGLRRLSRGMLEKTLARIAPKPSLATASLKTTDESPSDDFALAGDSLVLDLSRPRIRHGMVTGEISLRLDAQVHVPRDLPSPVLAALRRLATFPNPLFHEKLRLRFATFDTPRFLFAGEWHPDRLVLPRGALDECVAILEAAGATVSLQDAREGGTRVRWVFQGQMREVQQAAVARMLAEDTGVLCAPPGAGKTVMGCGLIARSRTSALVLVHRSVLVDQWRETAMRFLGLTRREIGIWRGATRRLTRRLDIAMLPSLARAENPSAVMSGYGIVIVDECHHVPAASFEAVLKLCASRRVYGLTATPKRKDRLEKLLFAQCGPIRHTLIEERADASRVVKIRHTAVQFPGHAARGMPIHELWEFLLGDADRAAAIVEDIVSCLKLKRSPLVLADRKTYLDTLAHAMSGRATGCASLRMDGQTGKRARAELLRQMKRHYDDGTPFVLFATASLIGEGFDLPQLDTLVLSMPLSFRGRLVQYAGRLHRDHEKKGPVIIFDYLDENHPITNAMFRRRFAGYKELGYRVEMPEETSEEVLFD